MKNLNSFAKQFLLLTTLIVGVQNIFFQTNADAARACRVVFARETGDVKLLDVNGRDKLNVSGVTLKLVEALFLEFGIEIQSKNLVEALEGASEVLRDGSAEASIERSEKMSKLGDKLIKIVQDKLTKEQNLMLSFYVAESVLKMERIPLSKYQTDAEPPVFRDSGALAIKDFHRYVESYINKTSLYANKNSHAGILGMDVIRHLYSNNSWILGFKDHDMFHLHYSYGHPFYLAINFMAARSINDKRFAMISSLWESIDDTQYSYESDIARYFKEKKRMSPQQGMIFLARASKATLEKIDTALNSSHHGMSEISFENGNWKPQLVKFGRDSKPKSAAVYDQELTDYINKSLLLMKDPTKKKFANYYRRDEDEKDTTDHDVCVY